MSQLNEESLLQAIKKDDIKTFDLLNGKACGACRLGRFPVLSLLYLYKSRRILSAYGEEFLKIGEYRPLREPAEISDRFTKAAGKCLRLYLNEVVSPLEMLLILDKTRRLKRVYPLTNPSEAVKGRLKHIYSIKYSLEVKFEGDCIIIDRRPLSYREKKKIATACLCSVLAVALAAGIPVTAVSLMPKRAEGEVTKLSHIDFNSTAEYTLKRDIVLPENYSAEKVNCKINGGGYKLTVSKGASLGELNGKISDLVIESCGEAVFTSVWENAAIENVTLNVNAAAQASAGVAFLAVNNYGIIDGVTLNVKGSVNALAPAEETAEEMVFGGIAINNSYRYSASSQTVYRGTIKNCTVNYSRLTLAGEAAANAAFGGVAGVNYGYLQDCTVCGEIYADTFDIGGICAVNNGLLSGDVNGADLVQTTADTGWNPITCGIVINNAYAVENCENKGKISAASACGNFELDEGYEATVSAAGIARLNSSSTNTPYIRNCKNSGSVEGVAEYRNVYAAGVCLSSDGGIDGCGNSGAVTVKADNGCGAYAGGIAAVTYGNIIKSVNEGAISVQGDDVAYAGGIAALSCAQITGCLSEGSVSVTAGSVCAGGILGISEVARYGFYVYCGTVGGCISKGNISAAANGETPPFVGGIAGFVREAGFAGGSQTTYFGGSVTGCYFIGEIAAEGAYCGAVAGVCGANIYESNSYNSGNYEYKNFENNFYTGGSLKAFGSTVSEEGAFSSADDKGATNSAAEDIQSLEEYKAILTALAR